MFDSISKIKVAQLTPSNISYLLVQSRPNWPSLLSLNKQEIKRLARTNETCKKLKNMHLEKTCYFNLTTRHLVTDFMYICIRLHIWINAFLLTGLQSYSQHNSINTGKIMYHHVYPKYLVKLYISQNNIFFKVRAIIILIHISK